MDDSKSEKQLLKYANSLNKQIDSVISDVKSNEILDQSINELNKQNDNLSETLTSLTLERNKLKEKLTQIQEILEN